MNPLDIYAAAEARLITCTDDEAPFALAARNAAFDALMEAAAHSPGEVLAKLDAGIAELARDNFETAIRMIAAARADLAALIRRSKG